MTSPAGHPSAQYLEAIYEIAEEGTPSRQARVAEWMGVSPASVSEAVKRLARDGLLVTRDRRLELTPEGERLARTLVRRHRLAEHFLIRVVGLPWHMAHEEAGRWERVISDDVERRLVVILDDPATCPHGNPIPGASRPVDHSRLVPLKELQPRDRAVLRRLTEDLELQLDVMRFLEASGLMPGAKVRVRSIAPDGTMSLDVRDRPVALGPDLSDHVWVERVG